MIDPWKRKTDQNRDLMAVGAANHALRLDRRAADDLGNRAEQGEHRHGARTKYPNLFHALFLLAFVLLLPFVLRMIPVAALAAMLVFAGFRLASPKEFVNSYRVGKEYLVVFVFSMVVSLAAGLLIGVVSGTLLKLLIHRISGAPDRHFLPFGYRSGVLRRGHGRGAEGAAPRGAENLAQCRERDPQARR